MDCYRYAILYHNYYSLEGIADIRRKIQALQNPGILLLCSLPDKFAEAMPRQEAHERFVVASNVGKDIGGKLILLQLLWLLDPAIPYAILLHDKRSYQKHSGVFEKQELFSIVSPEKFRCIDQSFASDARLGIACAKGFAKTEYLGGNTFATKNSILLKQLGEKYGLPKKDGHFVAGTMFWVRTALIWDFFRSETPLDIRATLEAGNVMDHEEGTITHCWERLLSWIVMAAGYKLKEF
jgi:hypothetical protein